LLNAIGLPELITHSREQYEVLAIELALNPQKLKGIKEKLERNRLTTPLFDTPLYTKHLEAAYEAMYQRHKAGLPPDEIEINGALVVFRGLKPMQRDRVAAKPCGPKLIRSVWSFLWIKWDMFALSIGVVFWEYEHGYFEDAHDRGCVGRGWNFAVAGSERSADWRPTAGGWRR
jgi:hypothetical protein